MSEEEKQAIYDLKLIIEQDKEELPYSKESLKNKQAILNLIDKLQKDNYKLDRENQHFFDRIQDLQKENEELSESNFHFLEINQKLIEEKPMIKKITEKELNLLEKIDKLQKENEELKNKCNIFYGISTHFINKDIIRDKIKKLEEQQAIEIEETGMSLLSVPIRILKELLGR